MDKILITGVSGLLGGNLAYLSLPRFQVYTVYNKHKVDIRGISLLQADLAKEESIITLEKIKPDIIIHCAALTNIDYCEQYPDQAYSNNVIASVNVAQLAKKCGAYLIHISTDNVFDGEKGNYKEEDKVNPINTYGKTKLEAESKILTIYPDSCIVRTNIYGFNISNKFSLAEWMLDKLRNKQPLPGFKDIYFSPIFVNELAKFLFILTERKHKGIIHIAGRERISKLDFAYRIAEIFGYDKKFINPVDANSVGLLAKRGKDMSFNVAKAEKILADKMPLIADGLKNMKLCLERGYVERLRNSRPKITAVIPALNEADTIEGVINGLKKYVDEIVLVDDASTDDTAIVAEKSGAVIVSHNRNQGYDRSIDDGFKAAAERNTDIVLTFDADGQHNPEDICGIVKPILDGKADVVIGRRPSHARLSEYLYAFIAKIKAGIDDPLCGLKAYHIKVYRDVGYFDRVSSIGTELMFRAKAKGYRLMQKDIRLQKRIDSSRFGRRFTANLKILRAVFKVLINKV